MAKIVLIDDHADLRGVMRDLLEAFGHDVLTAISCEDAMQIMQGSTGIDVIISDHRLPGMSGLEFLSHMRASEAYARIPIILNSADIALREKAVAAGVTEFWEKGSDDMLSKIEGLQSRVDMIDRRGA